MVETERRGDHFSFSMSVEAGNLVSSSVFASLGLQSEGTARTEANVAVQIDVWVCSRAGLIV